MPEKVISLTLADANEMAAVAIAVGGNARAGDIFLLNGPIGAGKTTFARAFIRARLGPQEDVPSPTFTLVQTYHDDWADIWHADLYRLTDPQDVVELGLTDAFDDAICLIEWPEILAEMTPATALHCTFAALDDHHTLTLRGNDADLTRLMAT